MMSAATGLIEGVVTPQAQQSLEPVAAATNVDFTTALAAAGVVEQEVAVGSAPSDAALQMLLGLFKPDAGTPDVAADDDGVASEQLDALLASGIAQLSGPQVPVAQPAAPESFRVSESVDLIGTAAANAVAVVDGAVPTGPKQVAVSRSSQGVNSLSLSKDDEKSAEPQTDVPAADQLTAPVAVASESSRRAVGAMLERLSFPASPGESHGEVHHPGPALYSETVALQATPVRPEAGQIQSSMGSPRWANELGSKVMLMSISGQQEGSLSLTPEHLGPVEVRINVTQDATNVWFSAQHAETRAALADALPRLRELFASSGLALGNAGVSHEMPREARRSERSGFSGAAGAADAVADVSPAPQIRRVHMALLDTWA